MKSKEDLKKKLTSEQYTVTQEGGTEAPFKNEYWDNKRPGIYVDLTSGEALFSSLDKFDSGTGWPSFSKGINDSKLETKTDLKFGMERTEVKSKSSNNHLGHVFNDGPKDAGGKRFCINSAALKFIPLEAMEKEGYSKYLPLFDGAASVNQSTKQTAVLAGGCFWGMEDLIRKLPGVVNTDVGYIGGETKDPTYEVVKTGKSGHAEALRVEFDPSKITYAQLLEYYFRIHDPTTLNQQGNDVGSQYRSAIFVLNEEQRKIAEEIKMANARKWPKPIVTQIVPYTEFKLAEGYHQDYLKKNPQGYTCHWVRP